MKFVVSNTLLQTHLQALSKVILSKTQFPIQNDFLFTLQGNALEVRATGGDTTMSCTLELASVAQEGSIAVPSKFILDLLGTFSGSEQPLSFDIDEASCSINVTSENGTFNFTGHNSAEFPTLPEIREDQLVKFSLDAGVFSNAFSSTIFATGEDIYRPVMSGILVELDHTVVTFVASDAHKLVRYRYHLPEEEAIQTTGSFIIHKKPAGLLKNLLARSSSTVQVAFDDTNATFCIDEYRLICRLIAGRFPNYNAIIPQYNPNVVTIERSALLNALTRVQVFASQSIMLVTISLSSNQIVLQAQDPDNATSGKELLKCQYDGQDMEIGFKSEYLIDILSILSSAEIQLQLSDPARPSLIVPVGAAEDQPEDVMMLLMPMKV